MAKSDEAQKQQATSDRKTMAASAAKKFKGVRMRTWGSWVSEIRAPNQKTRIWLGSYSTAEAAARAYDAALLCLKGPASAAPNLNFPISSSNTFTNPPMSPKSIQRIAAAAAATTAEHPNPLPLPPSDNYNHFVPSPYASSSATSFSSSSSQSPVSTPTSDQLYEDVASLPPQFPPLDNNYYYDYVHQSVDPARYNDEEERRIVDVSSWQGFDEFDQQQQRHGDEQLIFPTFDDDSLVSFGVPPALDDFYYEGDIRLWSFAE
ncbi:unnamed protein product [Linum tenue]|uniref:AP2/ERF domain-containing protein n=1 Tax=Linum tenue TaxID=586396 RepID=A0AAV0IDU2_9ROSI|nr:unnamed protein product [Linum tenue]